MIQGVRPYDGEYELDTGRAFNAREWRWIKKVSGYMPLTISDGLGGGDPDLVVAMAVIAMCRDGKIDREDGLRVADELSETPFDGAAILLIGDEVGDDEIPPALTSKPDEPSQSGLLEKPTFSGEPSTSGSERSDETPSVTTLLRSGTS